jgi:SAM-dependent methyltransferase
MVVVDEMLRLANVGPDDFVMDLGSGDGRVVIAAAKKFGARGVGVELDQHLLMQSEESARQAGVEARVKFIERDLFKTDLSPATVITMYLYPGVNRKLRPRLLALKPGTRIVSHDFDLEDWRPDVTSTIRKNVFLWIVPARVTGRWQIRLALPPIERLIEIEFTQRYQEVSGSARLNGVPAPVWEARLTGARLSFILVDTTDRDNEAGLYFEGRVAGDAIEGQVTRGVGDARAVAQWRAVRGTP